MGGGAKKPLGWFQAKVEAASTSGASTIGPFPPSLPRDLWRFLSSPAAQRLAWIYGDFDKFGQIWSGMRVDSGLVILLAIVTALVIVALALLFYSPGWF